MVMLAPPTRSSPRLDRRGLLAGALSGVVGVTVALGLSLATLTPSVPDLVADRALDLIPGPIFVRLVDWLQASAKPLLYVSIVAGMIATLGVAGGVFLRWFAGREWRFPTSPTPPRFRLLLLRALAFALALFLLQEAILLPLAGGGVAGSALKSFSALAIANRLAGLVAYGVTLALAVALLRPTPSPDDGDSRRVALRFGVVALLGLAGAGALTRVLGGARDLGSVTRIPPRSGSGLPEPVTPVGVFYSVSKNFIDPVVDRRAWRLTIRGLVDQPLRWSLDDLRALPTVEQMTTLQCVSNEVGGDLISNGVWRGVPLREALRRAGIQPGAVDVVFRCADDYTDSITIPTALDPTTLLVWEMNGEPLTDKHGGPLRAIVPPIYGMKHAKWIQEIEVVGEDYQGYWQRRGWSDTAVIKPMSRIDYPIGRAVLHSQPTEIGGIAFAGAAGVSRVEVSVDDGGTWSPATLVPPFGPLSWVFWTFSWTPE
ncbi:MAG: molybdopterin-dependent oxidoreductase, partial [Dehalococcoidia bacterium]|nr:molybdopterin-dependent oxidoreductase [Dehalococcoidia bacterium]